MNSPKMRTEIPASITTPDTVDTPLGTLRFFDGLPDADLPSSSAATYPGQQLLVVDSLRHADALGVADRSARFGAATSDSGTVQSNADGSVDVYFAPKAPAGKERNWIQTVAGKGWFTTLRLYGALEPWFDKTWRPGVIRLVR